MVIKNKDGSVYSLKKPNPLMNNQVLPSSPDEDSCIIHNFNINNEVNIKYNTPKIDLETSSPPSDTKEPIHAPNQSETILERSAPEPVIKKQIEEVIVVKQEENVIKEEMESCWCLPGEWRKHYDSLYGETKTNIYWGDKFSFQGKILNNNEMRYGIWGQKKIDAPSIIFIRKNRRWWKVIEVEEYNNGYLMTCMPSDTKPDFD